MTDDIWESNPDWQTLDTPAEGDIVQFKHINVFSHLVKVIVSSVDEDTVTGVVEAVFDWQSQNPMTGGEVLNLVGKEFTFKKNLMKKVIRKPAHLK